MGKREVLVPHAGAGAEIRAYLEQALGIPKRAKWFDVRFATGEAVTVRCEFYPGEAEEPPQEPDGELPASHGSLDD